MPDPGFRVVRLDDIPPVEDHGLDLDADWKPVRHHLDIDVFGIGAYQAAEPGQVVIEEHDEAGGDDHHELYFVHAGRAEFTIAGESFDAPAGTLVYLNDPKLIRKAVAAEAGTTVLAIGAGPGVAFEPSEWERRRTAEIPRVT